MKIIKKSIILNRLLHSLIIIFQKTITHLKDLNKPLKALQDNYKVKSDPFYLGKTFANEPLRNINTNFGKTFSESY
jgi:hypothetical protein